VTDFHRTRALAARWGTPCILLSEESWIRQTPSRRGLKRTFEAVRQWPDAGRIQHVGPVWQAILFIMLMIIAGFHPRRPNFMSFDSFQNVR
jgi:hypothetical protein